MDQPINKQLSNSSAALHSPERGETFRSDMNKCFLRTDGTERTTSDTQLKAVTSGPEFHLSHFNAERDLFNGKNPLNM